MGCGSSRAEAKRERKEKGKDSEEQGIPNRQKEGNGVGEIHKMFSAGQERVLESRVFVLPAASPHDDSEGLTQILPEYMLNPQAKQHEQNLKERYSESLPIQTRQSNGLSQFQSSANSGPTEGNYDGFAASIKYSLGLASIMNKYNIGSTNDIADYKNNKIFIKTKRAGDEPKRPTSATSTAPAQKPTGVKLPPIEQKDRESSVSLTPAASQANGAGVTNTLIFVQKKEKDRSVYNQEKDLLSALVGLNVRPTQYFLSSMNLQQLQGEDKPEFAPEDPNQRLRFVMFRGDKEKKKKKLYELVEMPENPEYARDLLDAAFAEREHEETKGVKKAKDLSVMGKGGVIKK